MDQDDATVGRIFTRRELMGSAAKLGLGLAAARMLAKPPGSIAAPTTQPRMPLVASPMMSEGPFFVDEKLNRTNLLEGTTRPSVINGSPLALAVTVYELVGDKPAPLKDAQVDVWHTDSVGVYSDESHPMNHENTAKQTWLRGYQITDADGNANFATIFPGWYGGRTPHIHFKVRLFSADGKSAREFTSQLYFKEADALKVYAQPPYAKRGRHDTRNEDDGIYADRLADGSMAGEQLLLNLAPADKGFATAFPIIVADSNLRTARNGRGQGVRRPR